MPVSDRFPDSFVGEEGATTNTPAYLYILTHPDGEVDFLTGYEAELSVTNLPVAYGGSDPQTFTASQIAHGLSEISTEFEKRRMTVSAASDNPKLRGYFSSAAVVDLSIAIIRVNSEKVTSGDTIDFNIDCAVVNSGVVQDVTFSGHVITASIIPAPFDVDRGVPRFFFQRLCNHPLFSTGCGLTAASFAWATTIVTVTRGTRSLEINGRAPATTGSGYHQYGYMIHDSTGLQFPITLSTEGGNTLIKLGYFITSFAINDAVTVYPGCAKTTAACAAFSNSANYGGFPHVPTKNPVIHSAQ